MCPNRNNPEEFVTEPDKRPTRAATVHCRMLGPGLVGWGRWGSGPCFLRVSEYGPDFNVAPTSGGTGGRGEIGAVLSLRVSTAPILRSSNFKDKASPCIPLWLGELHYVLVLRLKQ